MKSGTEISFILCSWAHGHKKPELGWSEAVNKPSFHCDRKTSLMWNNLGAAQLNEQKTFQMKHWQRSAIRVPLWIRPNFRIWLYHSLIPVIYPIAPEFWLGDSGQTPWASVPSSVKWGRVTPTWEVLEVCKVINTVRSSERTLSTCEFSN